MKFTVFGGSGFIGSNLIRSLRADGHEVAVPARDGKTSNAESMGHVLYCIGLTADFRTRPFETIDAHVLRLADILQNGNFASLLYLSSTRVYANAKSTQESAPLTVNVNDPSDLYNISKLAGESLCLSSGRDGVKIARLSNVTGAEASRDDFLISLMRAALEGHIELRSEASSSKDYILLEDVLNILPRIAVEGKSSIYNVASGVNITHGDIVQQLSNLTGCKSSVQPAAPIIAFEPIDVTRARKEFGFSASSVIATLPKLLEEFRAKVERRGHGSD